MKRYIWAVLIWLDQGGNAVLGPVWNLLLQPPEEARFGHPDETLSSVFGKNVRANRCKICKGICWVLNVLDPRKGDHCTAAIEDDRRA